MKSVIYIQYKRYADFNEYTALFTIVGSVLYINCHSMDMQIDGNIVHYSRVKLFITSSHRLEQTFVCSLNNSLQPGLLVRFFLSYKSIENFQ